MALVRETIGKFKGFGNDGNTPGEFLLSQNIKKSDFGCKVGWRASSLFTPLAKIINFVDGFYGVNLSNDSILAAPGTVAADATEGTQDWTNINNSKAEDAVYANSLVAVSDFAYTTPHYTSTSSVKGPGTIEEDFSEGSTYWPGAYLQKAATENSDYAICVISGSGGGVFNTVRLVKGGTIQGSDLGDGSPAIPTSNQFVSFGDTTNLWGSSFSYSDINASNFGVAFNFHGNPTGFTTHLMKITNLGFNLPSTATVNGIKVEIKCYSPSNSDTVYVDYARITVYYTYIDSYTLDPPPSTPACAFNTVKLVSGGSIVGDDKAAGNLSASNANYNFGSATDLWGTALTPAIINSSNFGCVVNFAGSGGATANYTAKFIKATNFGFAIPAGATVLGVIVSVKGKYRANVAEAGAYNSYADVDYISITVWYVVAATGLTDGNWRQDYDGKIYASMSSPDDLFYVPKSNACAGDGGLITDQKGRLIYVGTRYVGMYDGGVDYSTGTIQATNGSTAIVGTGTAFTAGMVGQVIKIGTGNDALFYKVATRTDNTHITIDANYAGTSGSGKVHTVFTKWTDQWKDLGANFSNLKPLELYEDYILIPIANNLALISTLDDSLNTVAFNLPTGFTIEGTKSGENGLLIGANDKRKKGYVMLWDCLSDRSIAPWIPLEDTLKSIVKVSQGWIVIGTQKIYLTNGYSIQVLKENFPDDSISKNYIYPSTFNGATSIGNTLFIANSVGTRSRSRKGIYAIDIPTVLMEFISVSSEEVYGESHFTIPALYASFGSQDSQFRLYYSSTSEAPAGTSAKEVGQILEVSDVADSFNPQWFITPPVGSSGNDKVLEAIILSMQYDFAANAIALFDQSFTITVKACPLQKSFFQYGTHATGGSGAKNQIYLALGSGDYEPFVEVGDEITVLNGANAGEVRQVLTVAHDGNNLVITVDSNFTNTPEIGCEVSIIPMKKIATLTVSNSRGLKDRFFVDVKNRIKGRKFLVKVEIAGYNPYIEFGDIDVIYDDKGIK